MLKIQMILLPYYLYMYMYVLLGKSVDDSNIKFEFMSPS